MIEKFALLVASMKGRSDIIHDSEDAKHDSSLDDNDFGSKSENEEAQEVVTEVFSRVSSVNALLKAMIQSMMTDGEGHNDFERYSAYVVQIDEEINLVLKSLSEQVPASFTGDIEDHVKNYMRDFNSLHCSRADLNGAKTERHSSRDEAVHDGADRSVGFHQQDCEEHDAAIRAACVKLAPVFDGDSLPPRTMLDASPHSVSLSDEISADRSIGASSIHCEVYRDDLAGDRDEGGDTTEDEDPKQLFLLEETALMSSLLAKLQERTSIIASQTNLLVAIELAIQNIFESHNPKYHLLPQVANNVFKALMCNDKVNKALAMYHSGKAKTAEDDIIGLDNEVTWGEIALGVAKKISNEEERHDLPEEIASLIANARAAVSQCEKKISLEKFIKVGLRNKIVLSSLVSLAIVYTVTSQLTLRMVCSESKESLKWRQDVEELHEAIHPGKEFRSDEKLSTFMTTVLHPGLRSADEEIFELSSRVLLGVMKILNMTRFLSDDVRAVVTDKYKAAQSITVEGSIDRSKADYCAGEGTIHARTRNRMVSQYLICFAHDVLVRKLGGETSGKDFLRSILCTAQDKIRTTFGSETFDMSLTLTCEKKKAIKKLLAAKSSGTRSLLIDNEEQVKAMQNILELVRTDNITS